jgi:hypothetical protein
MSEQSEGAFYRAPTWGERLRYWVGYGWVHQRWFDEEPEGCPYWAKTVVVVNLSFAHRLRLLLTGALQIDLEHRSNVQIDKMVSISSICLIGPGDDRLKRKDAA